MEAARRVVESTLERLQIDGSGSAGDVGGLNEDLRTLEELSRRTEERNARTFEAIHETMLKIVDRLATIEETRTDVAAGSVARSRTDAAPAMASAGAGRMRLDEAVTPPLGETALADARRKSRPSPAGRRGCRISPAVRRRRAWTGRIFLRRIPRRGGEAPPEPDVPGEPMEPGSGAPDLDAVIGKIRAERDDRYG